MAFEPFTTIDVLPDDVEPILQSSGGEIVIYAHQDDIGEAPLPMDLVVLIESPEGIIAVPLGSAFARGQWVDISGTESDQIAAQADEQ